MKCPECSTDLKGSGTRYTCPACDAIYTVRFTCRECGSVPSEIQSCGSVGFFCDTCNTLKSRTTMNQEFTAVS